MFALFFPALFLSLATPPQVMTFDDAVVYALDHHPSLRAAAWDEVAAEGAMVVARAASLPTLNGNVTAYHLSQNSTITLAENAVAVSFQLAVPLVAPQAWGDWRHAKTAMGVQHNHTEDIRRSLAIDVASAYFDVLLAARLVTVGDNAVQEGQEQFNYAHTRFAGGVGTQLDELRADQDLAQSEASRVVAADNLLVMQAALGVLLGVDRSVAAEPPLHMKTKQTFQAPEDDIESRADVLEAVASLAAAQQIEDDNWRDYSPSLLLRGNPWYVHPATRILPAWGWSASVGLSIPFFDGGARYGFAHQRHKATQERKATLEMVRRVAHAEVRAARAAFELAHQALEVAKRAGSAAHASVGLATQAYRTGSTDNLAVIDAQRSDRDAATHVAIAEDAVLRAHLAYLASVGMFPP